MRVHLANWFGVFAAVGLSLWVALGKAPDADPAHLTKIRRVAATKWVRQGDEIGLRDATDHFVPRRSYQRIISLSGVADSLLYHLVAPTRISALSPYAERAAFAYRYQGFRQLNLKYDAEALLALEPDLILTHHLSRMDRVMQLREAGLTVFDLGEMKGLDTLLPNIQTVANLLNIPERGRAFAYRIETRMARIADQQAPGPDAIYVGVHGDKMYGGTVGTSYHDVLMAAGLTDIAAGRYEGWTRYTQEHLLTLDPQVIVTQTGMARQLCDTSNLTQLRACSATGQVVEVDTPLLLSPGPEMVEAAEEVHRKVFE